MVRMKKIVGILILMLMILAVTVHAESGVYDNGALFTSSEVQELETDAAEVAQKYNMNIILLTTDDAQGMSSAEFAENFYESNGYVDNSAKGGIVLLIDMDHRELNLVTYDDMIYYITDEREERIYDAGFDEVADGEYGESMSDMLDAVEDYLEDGIPGNQYTYDVETGEIIRYRKLEGVEIAIAFAVALIGALIPCLILWRKYSVVEDFRYSVNENADMDLKVKEDHMIDMVVTKRRKPKPQSSGGGGSSSGRSSVHRSSGGHRVGGGHGRKF